MKDNVNLYTYVANSPVMYTDRMGLKGKLILGAIWNAKSVLISLVGRTLNSSFLGIPTGKIGSHTFIELTIIDNFGNINSYSVGGYKDDKILKTSFNDDNDIGWSGIKEYQAILTPTGMTDKEFATNIVNEAILYNQDPKDYALFSADNGNDSEGNCHNFSTTMLLRASNYSSSILSTTEEFNPSGLNPGLGEYFEPICTE